MGLLHRLNVGGLTYNSIIKKGQLMKLEIENFGYCPDCQTETAWDECSRCGQDVCLTCHPDIGCDV